MKRFCVGYKKGKGLNESPERGARTQTGVVAPGDWYHIQGSPGRATRVFRAFSTPYVGTRYNGGDPPACNLASLSGLGMDEHFFRISEIILDRGDKSEGY